jgi:hypothetical protein
LTIKGGVSLAALAGLGLWGRHALLPPRRSECLDSVDALAVRLYDSLDTATRDRACVDYDHPLRQYHNRGVSCGGVDISGRRFSREQRLLLTDLLYAGLSEQGWSRLPSQFFINWPGVHLLELLICGDPRDAPYQILLSGPHLNLRLGGRSREGVAFGGPMVYGDQRGNNRQGLPRNVYRYQFQKALRLFRSLEPRQQQAVVLARSPIQTQIELQGRHGSFAGIEVAELSRAGKTAVGELVDSILSTYAGEDVAYARHCLAENGGLDGLFLSYYEEGEVDGSGEYQIFRLEGPAAVFYFRGFPHVHAFVNIGMDGDAPLSVGKVLGENPVVMEGAQVKQLFEDAMLWQAGTDLVLYPEESVVGRLRPGSIRTGDIYNLESWQESLATTEIRGGDVRGELLQQLRRTGSTDPDRMYSVVTTNYAARERSSELLGKVGSWQRGILIRDATIAYLKDHGFRSQASCSSTSA